MNDKGLADVEAANPFRLPRNHPGIGDRDRLTRGMREVLDDFSPEDEGRARPEALFPSRASSGYSALGRSRRTAGGLLGALIMQCRQCEPESAVNDEELCQKCAQLVDRARQLIERDELPKFSVHEFRVTAGRSRTSGQRCALCGDVILDAEHSLIPNVEIRRRRCSARVGYATTASLIAASTNRGPTGVCGRPATKGPGTPCWVHP